MPFGKKRLLIHLEVQSQTDKFLLSSPMPFGKKHTADGLMSPIGYAGSCHHQCLSARSTDKELEKVVHDALSSSMPFGKKRDPF